MAQLAQLRSACTIALLNLGEQSFAFDRIGASSLGKDDRNITIRHSLSHCSDALKLCLRVTCRSIDEVIGYAATDDVKTWIKRQLSLQYVARAKCSLRAEQPSTHQ